MTLSHFFLKNFLDDEKEDEETMQSDDQMVDYMSDVEDNDEERIVEYDSEENEASNF